MFEITIAPARFNQSMRDRTYGRSHLLSIDLLFNPTFFVTYDHTIFRGKKQRSRSLVFGDRNRTVLEQEIVL